MKPCNWLDRVRTHRFFPVFLLKWVRHFVFHKIIMQLHSTFFPPLCFIRFSCRQACYVTLTLALYNWSCHRGTNSLSSKQACEMPCLKTGVCSQDSLRRPIIHPLAMIIMPFEKSCLDRSNIFGLVSDSIHAIYLASMPFTARKERSLTHQYDFHSIFFPFLIFGVHLCLLSFSMYCRIKVLASYEINFQHWQAHDRETSWEDSTVFLEIVSYDTTTCFTLA